MRLDAVTNLNNRNTANINLLTHFEYKRVLKLVEEGKTFAEAKRQASREVLGAFGVEIEVSSAEDLDIFNTSEGDRTLYNISKLVDNRSVWDHWNGEGDEYDRWAYYYANENIDCSGLQAFIDGFANDYADDGVLSDTIMQWLVSNAYDVAQEYSHLEYIDEDDMREKDAVDPGSYEILSDMKKEYEFAKFLFLNYMGLERCSEDLWGAYREFHRPIQVVDTNDYMLVVKDSGYFLCDGYSWELTTMERIEAMSTMIDHENGFMTDPRDGQEYKTVSFVHKGKTYEWMAEDLMYSATPVVHSRRATGSRPAGIYTWTEAMRLNESYMTKVVPNDMVDSLHQGICPDGWHLANAGEWEALLDYVGGVNNLLDENWRTSRYYAFGKGLTGVFYNRFDFNLVPMDKDLLEIFYHTYGKNSYGMTPEPEEDMKEWIESIEDDEFRETMEDWFMPKITGTYALELSIGRSIYREDGARSEGRVRCVRN